MNNAFKHDEKLRNSVWSVSQLDKIANWGPKLICHVGLIFLTLGTKFQPKSS